MKLVGKNNPKLTTVCEFTGIEKAVKIQNKMRAFISRNRCLGLAANQVGSTERVCWARVGGTFDPFIDAHIIERKGRQLSEEEGCLSFPGVRGNIERPQHILVRWKSIQDWKIRLHEGWFHGMDAIVLEHEIDHLDGIRCIDKMNHREFS